MFVGKNVLLEQPKKSGNKVISHVLTSHAGMYIGYQLFTGWESVLENIFQYGPT